MANFAETNCSHSILSKSDQLGSSHWKPALTFTTHCNSNITGCSSSSGLTWTQLPALWAASQHNSNKHPPLSTAFPSSFCPAFNFLYKSFYFSLWTHTPLQCWHWPWILQNFQVGQWHLVTITTFQAFYVLCIHTLLLQFYTCKAKCTSQYSPISHSFLSTSTANYSMLNAGCTLHT